VGSKGRPYRRLDVEGFEILIGKGDAEKLDHLFANVSGTQVGYYGGPASFLRVRAPPLDEPRSRRTLFVR
jgi:hypothetical protein